MPAEGGAVDPGWCFVSIGAEGHATTVGGVDPWVERWTRTGGPVIVAHPTHPEQHHQMATYEVPGPGGAVAFAAGEVSNGVWAFYVPC